MVEPSTDKAWARFPVRKKCRYVYVRGYNCVLLCMRMRLRACACVCEPVCGNLHITSLALCQCHYVYHWVSLCFFIVFVCVSYYGRM